MHCGIPADQLQSQARLQLTMVAISADRPAGWNPHLLA
jgi:hypothetical protein